MASLARHLDMLVEKAHVGREDGGSRPVRVGDRDGQGRRVFDGMMPYATGVGRMFLNVRWAQPTVSNQQHSRRYTPEHEFPHRYATAADPITGKTDGLLARCAATNTCPVIMNVESANEYWNKGTSLNHTDAQGKDLDVDAEAPRRPQERELRKPAPDDDDRARARHDASFVSGAEATSRA